MLTLDSSGISGVTWAVNWGDGIIEQVSGESGIATHLFSAATVNTVTATLTLGGTEFSLPASHLVGVGLASNTNLVRNGGFEDPVITNSEGWDIFGAIPGWTLTFGPSIEIQRNLLGGAAERSQFVELDADENGPGGVVIQDETGSSGISQAVSVVPGLTYTLSFAFRARLGTDASENALDVNVASGNSDQLLHTTVYTANTSWTTYS